MQLLPRYLVDNRITIIMNDAGFVTEYKPVYNRQVKLQKGIDNKLQFRLLNADQKPINVANYTPKFVVYDENENLIIEHDGTNVGLDDSSATRGLFEVTVTENDLLNVKSQYLKYNVYLVNNTTNEKTMTYSNAYFDGCGTIYVDTCQFPGPLATYSVTTFTEDSGQAGVDDSVWYSETLDAQPGINGNEALHTAAIYTSSFAGTVTVQATLDNQVTGTTAWANISDVTFTGSETEPKPVNFTGVFNHLRFKANANPSNKISKILVRN